MAALILVEKCVVWLQKKIFSDLGKRSSLSSRTSNAIYNWWSPNNLIRLIFRFLGFSPKYRTCRCSIRRCAELRTLQEATVRPTIKTRRCPRFESRSDRRWTGRPLCPTWSRRRSFQSKANNSVPRKKASWNRVLLQKVRAWRALRTQVNLN